LAGIWEPAAVKAYDLIVVGGGVGGSALAAVMARAGSSVLLLEPSLAFEDHVRGEWIAPWGVAETRRLGLYDVLVEAGGHHLLRHVTYDESLLPAAAEARAMPLGIFATDVPGPLCIGHPHHCQTLFDEAGRAGATVLRGARVTKIVASTSPSLSYEHDGTEHAVKARLIAAADGRTSPIRETAGIRLHQDKAHHWFAGLLLDGAQGWDEVLQAVGTEGDFNFLAFPQGKGRVRVYGGYALEQRKRFSGPDSKRNFLESFRMISSPNNKYLAAGTPAGPLFSYVNNDSWTNEPCAEGVVLVGDAAGWNDPIIGLGLSITYRDVRIIADILKTNREWNKAAFAPYSEERRERMRRLRFVASLDATLNVEFGPAARERRRRYHERAAADPSLALHGVAVMAGPEAVPAETFTEAYRMRVLGPPPSP
jgi:2-polyprenyl-6-methoxyphenol hydroxylase-like FAD-dependent oxidoreductase